MIRIERTFPASPARVFTAWTDPGELAAWLWGSLSDDVTATVDLRVGGAYECSTARPDGERWSCLGEYLEIEPGARLAYTMRWTAPMGYEAPDERVTATFHAEGDSTRLIVEHDGVPAGAAERAHVQAWENMLDHLGKVIGPS
jgi:uncharacterized protein YndB with AHSA1/START domain